MAPTEAMKLAGAFWMVPCLLISFQTVCRWAGVKERLLLAIECAPGGDEAFDITRGSATLVPEVSAAVAAMAMRCSFVAVFPVAGPDFSASRETSNCFVTVVHIVSSSRAERALLLALSLP